MSNAFLQTKINIPSSRPHLVPRPHLLERLDQGLDEGCHLTLISAPAGYGKTTLAGSWGRHRQGSTAWLSLDEGDNDPVRCFGHLILALQSVAPDAGEAARAMLRSSQAPAIEVVLTTLLNELEGLSGLTPDITPILLVLDDYHRIDAQSIHRNLAFLLENTPDHLHWVLITRADRPLPLSRLRVRNQVNEIRQADLSFTSAEAAAFFHDVMGLSLTPEEVEALDHRTEGWIAGLQLAALSLRHRDDITDFVAEFSGSHRFVIDYLTDEVLGVQDPDTRQFLLQTAILERLNPDLCDAVAQRSDSHIVLSALEQANHFLIPLDDGREWFRYHHLFADSLRQRLRQEDSIQVTDLHHRAARWHEAHGDPGEAIQHALDAEDPDHAARLVERYALPTLECGEMSTVLGWLAKLPHELTRTRPWLCVVRGWASILTGRVEEVGPALRDAAKSVEVHEQNGERQHLLGHLSSLQAYLALLMGDSEAAGAHAQAALARLPQEDLSARAVVTFTQGAANLLDDNIGAACRAFAQAGDIGRAGANIHLAVAALTALGSLQSQCGGLHAALETFDRALQLATQPGGQILPVAAGAYGGKGRLSLEWNDLDAASAHLERAVALAEQWGNIDALVANQAFFARVALTRGDIVEAQTALTAASSTAQGKQLAPTSESWLAASQVETWLAGGRVEEAAHFADERGLQATDRLGYVREVEYIALARLLIAQQAWRKAETLLVRLRQAAEAGGRMGRLIEINVLYVLVLQHLGKEEDAETVLVQTLALAEPEGYVRTFVDGGASLPELLKRLIVRKSISAYAAHLMAAFPQGETGPIALDRPDLGVVESLSEHEVRVLRLIAAGLSNREAADKLIVSVNTVKWHLKNLYAKLHVRSRVEAVSRARELGLL